MQKEAIRVDGMSCQHCVGRVRTALEEMDGVEIEAVDIGEVRVRRDPERADRDAIVAAIRTAGYSPQ